MAVNLRTRSLKNGAFGYFLDYRIAGKRVRENLNIKILPSDSTSVKNEKKKLAEYRRSNREIEMLSAGTTYIPEHLKDVNFFDYADAYTDFYNKKDSRMVKASVKKFKDFVKNDALTLAMITESMMYGFKDHLLNESGLSGETPQNYFVRFKKVLKSAVVKGLINKNPADNIKFKKPSGDDVFKKQILDIEELKTLVKTKCGNEEIKKAFLFACYTGLGYAEIKLLTWGHIVKGNLITKREKSNRKVEIKLKDSILKLIGKPKAKNSSIFNLLNNKGTFISTNGVNKCIKTWVQKAELDKHITFYCARHTFATQLLIHGANLKTVADAMGHSSTKNTVKYLNYIDNLKDKAIDNLPEIDF